MEISNVRGEIDALDNDLLRLLNRRAQLALQVGASKKRSGVHLCDHTREREVIERMCAANEGPLDERGVVELYRAIIHESRRIQTRPAPQSVAPASTRLDIHCDQMRVAFQGEPGAFSEQAAFALLGEQITLVPRPRFESLYTAISDNSADYLLAPVENSLMGFVHPSFDQLLDSQLAIIGEVIIRVSHCLIGCAGSTLQSIMSVESHPVALEQCRRFLAANPNLRRIVAEDTAGSVANVLASGDLTRAAIAGKGAAQRYGGVILREHLEDSSENYTRFFLLSPERNFPDDADKLSLVLELPHQPGALHSALEPFARRDIDLLKIEGRPVKGRPWEYCFYLEARISHNDRETAEVLDELRRMRVEARLLGSFKACEVPEN